MNILHVIILTVAILGITYTVPAMRTGEVELGDLENIHGIPYPLADGATLVQESLAHADIYLSGPVLAKNLELTITFIPQEIGRLDVGIRDNPFWLGYPKHTLYERGTSPSDQQQTARVTVPLTDAIQESNRSIDMMFFASQQSGAITVDAGIQDTTAWQLISVDARTSHTLPTTAQLKDYIKSIALKERPL